MKNVILTGDRPTGKLHIGHYVGSLKRRVELQNSGAFDKIYIMIADAQALTDNFDNPDKVRANITEVALDYFGLRHRPEKIHRLYSVLRDGTHRADFLLYELGDAGAIGTKSDGKGGNQAEKF